jgi:hypothetical protein
MFKKDKSVPAKVIDAIAPPKQTSAKKKAAGIGLASAAVAAGAAVVAKKLEERP